MRIQMTTNINKEGRWVAKLVAHLLATEKLSTGFESKHRPKYEMGDISKGVAKSPPKK